MNTNTTINTVTSVLSTTAKALVVALALGTGALVSGCLETESQPPAIIGEWVADESVCGENSWIEMDDDLTGEARVFFYLYGECMYADYEVEVEDLDGDEYEISFRIEDREFADLLDFEMECEVEDDDEIECEGTDVFDGAEWVFEKD